MQLNMQLLLQIPGQGSCRRCRTSAPITRRSSHRRALSVVAKSTQLPLVVVGSINADYVLSVDRLPLAGETLSASTLDIFPGGKVRCGMRHVCGKHQSHPVQHITGCQPGSCSGAFGVQHIHDRSGAVVVVCTSGGAHSDASSWPQTYTTCMPLHRLVLRALRNCCERQ